MSNIRGAFIKLAVLLDKELKRENPFESIRYYEELNQMILKETADDLEMFEVNEWRYKGIRHHKCLYYHKIRDFVIRSNYGISRESALQQFSSLAMKVLECKNKQKKFDEERGLPRDLRPCAMINGKAYSDEEEIAYLVEEIREMSNEEFENYKDLLFDL